MSGVSLAVAPRSDPSPPNPDKPSGSNQSQNTQKAQSHHRSVAGLMGSLRVVELQLVAFIIVFSASGLVPILDLAFPAFASAYFLILSRFVFPSHSKPSSSSTAEIFRGGKLFRLHVWVGTSIGLFLPLAYVLGGFARGDDRAVRSATPHLFLLPFQILTENVIGGLSLLSPLVRALVPLLYTVRRIFVIINWMADVWLHKTIPPNAEFKAIFIFSP